MAWEEKELWVLIENHRNLRFCLYGMKNGKLRDQRGISYLLSWRVLSVCYITVKDLLHNYSRKLVVPHGNCFFFLLSTLSSKPNLFCPGWCGSADWVPAQEQKGHHSTPSQGTCLGCRPGPQLGAHKRQPHTGVPLPLFLPPFPTGKINKILKKKKNKQPNLLCAQFSQVWH